jgi:type I restriction-modification system DNA methylase subunit
LRWITERAVEYEFSNIGIRKINYGITIMNGETHSQLANFIWSICNLLRGPYKRNEYLKVILPLTVLRRFDCLKEPQRKAKVQLIDARNFWVAMEKSLGNKRRRIGDPSDKAKDPDHIGDITRIYANFTDGETRSFTVDGKHKELVVSKVFDNEDFGYHKITVERPLRLNFQANAERIARLEQQTAFINLASSSKKNQTVRQQEIEAGRVPSATQRVRFVPSSTRPTPGLFQRRP